MTTPVRKGAFALVCSLALVLSACASDEVPAPPEPALETTDEPARTSGDSRDDRVLAAAILAQLAADPDVDATAFDVSVTDAVATVSGDGGSPSRWERARDLAARVQGVEQVLMADPQPVRDGSAEPEPTQPITVRELATRFPEATRIGTPPDELFELRSDEGSGDDGLAQAASGDRPRTYVVQAGDSLSIIAQRTMGDGLAWRRIYELNRSVIGPNPQALQAGMELRIPQD